jgi:Ca2+-binding EF-hand superfamily protein
MSALGNSTLEDMVDVAFRSFDLNNDGTISRGKLECCDTLN